VGTLDYKKTKFGNLPNKWTLVSLPDLVFFQEGPGLRKWQWTDEGMKVINGRNILLNSTIDLSNTDRYISNEEFNDKYSHFGIEDRDAVVTSSGTIGKVARINQSHLPLMMNTSVIRFHSLNQKLLDSDYLYYFLNSHLFKNQAESFAIGSAQRNFGPSHLKLMKIALPTIEVQRKIAKILTPYDNLIDNISQRVDILEEMAGNLYKEWFVNFRFPGHEGVNFVDSELGNIPEGWKCKTLHNCISVLETGSRPKGGVGKFNEGVPSIGGESIRGAGKFEFTKPKFIPIEFFNKMKKGIVEDRDVLVYKDGGKPGYFIPHISFFGNGFPYEAMALNSHVYRLRGSESVSQEFLYYHLSSEKMLEWMHLNATGSAIPSIARKDLIRLPVILPPPQIMREFTDFSEDCLSQILILANKLKNLRFTRSFLIKNIFSGEYDI
jgi:type I restriction enzyme, S subunit